MQGAVFEAFGKVSSRPGESLSSLICDSLLLQNSARGQDSCVKLILSRRCVERGFGLSWSH